MANELQHSTDPSAQMLALGASESLVKRVMKVGTNFALMENPKLPRIKASSDGLLMDASNPDDVEIKEVKGVIVFGAKYKAWYEEKYDKENKVPPTCFSHDARLPDSTIEKPPAKTCKECPKNKFETADVGSGKACRDMRRLFLLLSVEEGSESIMPIQLNVTPTSLKAWDDYLGKLVMYGYSVDEVETIVTAKKKDRDDKYVVLSFAKGASYADKPAVLGNIKALKAFWLPHMERSHAEQDEVQGDAAAAEPTKSPKGSGEY